MKSRQVGLLRSTMVVSLFTMISRVLGFVRDMVIARQFGASPMIDAFLVAFKIPNFMRRLFAEGAFSQAFVPILAEYQSQKSKQDLLHFLGVICGTLTSLLVLIVILVELTAPVWIRIFAPGFEIGSERFDAATYMLRWTFPYLALISVTAFTSSVLNSFSKFAVPAATPIFLNVVMIIFAVRLGPYFQVPIHALAVSVFVAGIVQCLFQWPFLMRLGLVFRPRMNWRNQAVTRLLKQMVPALFGVSVAQINLLLDTLFASFLPVGSISWLYYSDRLMNFPLGVFGVAISTVILPHLSRACAHESDEHYQHIVSWSMRSVLVVGVPSAIGLALLAHPLLTMLFQYGAFSARDVLQSSYSLVAFSLGIPAFMLVKVLASAFYAKQDIRTPVRIGAAAMVLNIILNLLLIQTLKHMGLALATSIAAYVNIALLIWALKERGWYVLDRSWGRFFAHITIASVIMVFVIMALKQLITIDTWQQWAFMMRLTVMLIWIAVSSFLYFAVLYLFGYRLKDFQQFSNI